VKAIHPVDILLSAYKPGAMIQALPAGQVPADRRG
jgi:hypothetical protein